MRALITGASSGIGRACAVALARDGYSLVLVSRREDELETVRRALPNASQHVVIACDLSKSDEIDRLMDKVAAGGKLNGLVHAAGIGPAVPITFIDDSHLMDVFNINYFAFLRLMKHCAKPKLRGEHFSVVAISSVAALAGWGGVSVYAGSKGALCASVRALAIELAPKGVRVNAVCPGHTQTPMLQSVALTDVSLKQPLGILQPEHVAEAVAFLLSEKAATITGTILPVDGGYTAQ